MRFLPLIAANYFSPFFMLCVLFFLSAFAFAKPPYLEVYPVISGDKEIRIFKIEQIAKLKNVGKMKDVDVARINATTVVLPLDSFESRQYLQGAAIKNAILAAMELRDSALVDINAPPRVVVKFRAETDITVSAIAVAKEALKKHLDKYYRKSSLTLVIAPNIKYDGELRFVPREISGLVKNRTAVWVDAYNEGNLIQSVPVWFEVKAHMEVLVLKSAVKRGDVVSRNHFIIKSKEIRALPTEAVHVNEMSDEQFGDFIYAGDVAEQVVFDRRMIKKAKAINFGDDVKVVSKSGRVSITTNAIAQDSADIGDYGHLRK